MKSVADQAAEAAPKLGLMKKIKGDFIRGIKVAATTVHTVLQFVGPLLQALDAVESTESALAGNGFVFTQQVAQTRSLASQAGELLRGYREAGYHANLDKMIDLAKELDKANPEGLYGADELSNFCASVRSDVAKYESDSKDLLDEMNKISSRALTGRNTLESLFDNPVFMTAANLNGQDAVMFMAHQDFDQIIGILAVPIIRMTEHHTQVEADLKRIKDNILDTKFGWNTDE